MGAGNVVATGRNERSLENLVERFGPRVRPAPMSGDESADRELISTVANSPIDLVLDLLPREATSSQVLAALTTVRPGGRIVLMGGVGRAGGTDLALPYPWLMRNDITIRGKWMYARDAIVRMIRMVRAGMIDLECFDLTEFALDDANEAIQYANDNGGPLRLTVLRPDW
jgi:alcohol dehydrogenase